MQSNGELDMDLLLEEAGSFHAFQYKYIILLGIPWTVCGCLTMVRYGKQSRDRCATSAPMYAHSFVLPLALILYVRHSLFPLVCFSIPIDDSKDTHPAITMGRSTYL